MPEENPRLRNGTIVNFTISTLVTIGSNRKLNNYKRFTGSQWLVFLPVAINGCHLQPPLAIAYHWLPFATDGNY